MSCLEEINFLHVTLNLVVNCHETDDVMARELEMQKILSLTVVDLYLSFRYE